MNKVHLCDCMEFMRNVPDKYYELAIVDPPYGIGIDGQKGDARPYGSGKYHASKWTRKQYEFKGWDKQPTNEYFDQLFRISVNQIVWGGNYFIRHLSISKGWIFWYKGQNGLTMSDGELAWSSFDKPTRQINLNRMALTIEGTIHPTQKPVALYKWLLKNYAKPNDKIFDSHVGSGSIRIACHDMGFDFEGCEIDKDYWKAQEERFNTHISQLDLFSGKELQESIMQGVLV